MAMDFKKAALFLHNFFVAYAAFLLENRDEQKNGQLIFP